MDYTKKICIVIYIFDYKESGMVDNRFINQDYSKKAKVWIVVATHKKYDMPDDKMYIPIHVGAEGKLDSDGQPLDLGFQKDNTGDNISEKNPQFCELTGLYWAWKNLKADYIGLVHYRRHFRGARNCSKKGLDNSLLSKVLTYRQFRTIMNDFKVIVPRKRRYFIETLEQHYAHNHYIEELNTARDILFEKYPEYEESYRKAMGRTWGYMFNMMILKRDLLDEYCSWIFDILFEMEKRMNDLSPDSSGRVLTSFENRYPGRVSERFFNVWLEYQLKTGRIQKNEIKELPFMYTEKINKINKGITFLKAKFLGVKPQKSF